MQKQPLLILLIFAIAGIFFADFFQEKISVNMLIITTGFCGLGYFFLPKRTFHWLRGVILGLAFSPLFATFHYLQNDKKEPKNFEGKQVFKFKIKEKLNSSEKYRKYEAKIIGIKDFPEEKPFSAIIHLEKSLPSLDFQYEYQSEAFINIVEPTDNDFQFNYAKYLSRKGIYYQIFIKEPYYSKVKTELSFFEKLASYRLKLLQKIDKSGLSSSSKDLLKGLILADRTEMSQEIITDFRNTGLSHLLAISGGHIAIIFGLIMIILQNFFLFIHPRKRIIIALLSIWAFAIFINLGYSVVRSCLMISIYYIYYLLQRLPDLLHSVALSALILLSINTQSIYDIGFQLSYFAVLGIYCFNTPLVERFYKGKNRPLKWLLNIISISISAQLGTLPLILYHFHQYSWSSIMSNLIIIPFFGIIITFSCFMVLIYILYLNFNTIELIYDTIISYTLKIIHFLGKTDFLLMKNIPFGKLELIISLTIIYFLYSWSPKRDKMPLKLIFSILFFTICRIFLNFYWDNKNEIIKVSNFGETVVLIKEKNTATMYISEKKNTPKEIEKLHQYIGNPYITSRRLGKIDIKTYPNSAEKLLYNDKEISLENSKNRFQSSR